MGMEKLEQILHAEESARRILADAKARSRDIRKESLAEAELVVASAARSAIDEAAAKRAQVLRDAEAEAAGVERDAESELAGVVARAEGRIADAAAAVVAKLVG